MKQKLINLLQESGFYDHVRIAQQWGSGYILKIKDGDGEINEYRGYPLQVKRILSEHHFQVQKDGKYNYGKGEYSYIVNELN